MATLFQTKYQNVAMLHIHSAAALMVGIDPPNVRLSRDDNTGCFYIDPAPQSNISDHDLMKLREAFNFLMNNVDSMQIITGSFQAIGNPEERVGGYFDITISKYKKFIKSNSINEEGYTLKSFVYDYVRKEYNDCYLKKADITTLLQRYNMNDRYFNPAKPETENVTPIEPERAVIAAVDDSKSKPTKKAKGKGWSLPWADLEYDDESGADKFDEDRYAQYYVSMLQKFNITEQEGRAYVMRHDCKRNNQEISFKEIGERLGVSGERARKLYNRADGKIKLSNEAKSKAEAIRRSSFK